MVSRKQESHFYEFGPFRIDATERFLLCDGQPVPLAPKAFDLLLALVENCGHILEKDDLMKRLWPDTFVEEANLANNISLLRKVLGEGFNGNTCIQTVPRRGYKFIAEVKELRDEEAEPEIEQSARLSFIEEEVSVEQEVRTATEATAIRRVKWWTNRSLITQLLATCVVLIGIAVAAFYLQTTSRPKPLNYAVSIKSIAVLPFKPLVADSRDESLEMGMADTLITRLSNIQEIIVRPISAVRKYTGLEQDAVEAGRELLVDSVLDGSIQKVGERLRVTVTLAKVADGSKLWADKFDEKFTDILSVQDSISERVAGALLLKLTVEERRLLSKRYTDNTDAYESYLKGRYFWNKRTPEDMKKAIEYFQQAIDLDPNYALAYTGLADSYPFIADWIGPQSDFYDRAKAAAMKAVELDDTIAEAHTSLAAVESFQFGEREIGEAEFKRAIDLNPNYATAHHWYSNYLIMEGRLDEAMEEINRAHNLDPVSPIINTTVGMRLFEGRQYDEAIGLLRKTLEFDSNFALAHLFLGRTYVQKGMYEEALAEFQKAINLTAGRWGKSGPGYVYAVTGRRAEAQEVLAELRKQYAASEGGRDSYVGAIDLAIIYAGLREREQALIWLRKAFEEKDRTLGWDLRWNPEFDSLRSDPRFADLLRRMGFPQ